MIGCSHKSTPDRPVHHTATLNRTADLGIFNYCGVHHSVTRIESLPNVTRVRRNHKRGDRSQPPTSFAANRSSPFRENFPTRDPVPGSWKKRTPPTRHRRCVNWVVLRLVDSLSCFCCDVSNVPRSSWKTLILVTHRDAYIIQDRGVDEVFPAAPSQSPDEVS